MSSRDYGWSLDKTESWETKDSMIGIADSKNKRKTTIQNALLRKASSIQVRGQHHLKFVCKLFR